jgi:hypothetical protein
MGDGQRTEGLDALGLATGADAASPDLLQPIAPAANVSPPGGQSIAQRIQNAATAVTVQQEPAGSSSTGSVPLAASSPDPQPVTLLDIVFGNAGNVSVPGAGSVDTPPADPSLPFQIFSRRIANASFCFSTAEYRRMRTRKRSLAC